MTEPASIRYKNPGAMWGSALAIKWGAAPKGYYWLASKFGWQK
jgi:hypothetical protein